MASVLFGEPAVLVFEHPPTEVVRHSDVDCSRLASDDVNAVAMVSYDECKQQVPRLRIAIGFANRNATLGMTDWVGWHDVSEEILSTRIPFRDCAAGTGRSFFPTV
jgi:hypothetical protein